MPYPLLHLHVLVKQLRVILPGQDEGRFRSEDTEDTTQPGHTQVISLVMSDTSSPDEDSSVQSGKKLLHVFVQDESVFDELLQVFATAETTSSMIMDADESTRYLMDIPFYAGFWNTDIQHFNRIIVSVIRNELVNATIRNIEFICGPLSERTDIMITVSDLHSVHGSLES